jgi:hypothetical protein
MINKLLLFRIKNTNKMTTNLTNQGLILLILNPKDMVEGYNFKIKLDKGSKLKKKG